MKVTTLEDFILTLNEEEWVRVLDNDDKGIVFCAGDYWDHKDYVKGLLGGLLSVGIHNVSIGGGTEETDGEPCFVVCMNPHG